MESEFKINIYPVAYVALGSSAFVDWLQQTFNHWAEGDGGLVVSLETIAEELSELEEDKNSEFVNLLNTILAEIEKPKNKATDIIFYRR